MASPTSGSITTTSGMVIAPSGLPLPTHAPLPVGVPDFISPILPPPPAPLNPARFLAESTLGMSIEEAPAARREWNPIDSSNLTGPPPGTVVVVNLDGSREPLPRSLSFTHLRGTVGGSGGMRARAASGAAAIGGGASSHVGAAALPSSLGSIPIPPPQAGSKAAYYIMIATTAVLATALILFIATSFYKFDIPFASSWYNSIHSASWINNLAVGLSVGVPTLLLVGGGFYMLYKHFHPGVESAEVTKDQVTGPVAPHKPKGFLERHPRVLTIMAVTLVILAGFTAWGLANYSWTGSPGDFAWGPILREASSMAIFGVIAGTAIPLIIFVGAMAHRYNQNNILKAQEFDVRRDVFSNPPSTAVIQSRRPSITTPPAPPVAGAGAGGATPPASAPASPVSSRSRSGSDASVKSARSRVGSDAAPPDASHTAPADTGALGTASGGSSMTAPSASIPIATAPSHPAAAVAAGSLPSPGGSPPSTTEGPFVTPPGSGGDHMDRKYPARDER